MSRASSEDYYALLGIAPTAGVVELRRAWRRLAVQWHPDRAGHAATATFQKILAAYTVLADPVARAAYDRKRSGGTGRRAPGIGDGAILTPSALLPGMIRPVSFRVRFN